MIRLTLTPATQYATAYDNDKPVATVARKRVYSSGPIWTVYALSGALLGTADDELQARRIIRECMRSRANG